MKKPIRWIILVIISLTMPAVLMAAGDNPRGHAGPGHLDAHNNDSTQTASTGHSQKNGMAGHSAETASPAHDHKAMMALEKSGVVGIDERTGHAIPFDIRLTNQSGETIRLSQLVDRPTILLPVYYECPGVCGILMSSLATALAGMPKKDRGTYRAITVSFDADDTAESAALAQTTYLNLLDRDYPPGDWQFLTGDQHNIDRLLGAMGYRVVKQKKHLFQHPNALIILSADQTIIRYIYGTRFLPFDVGMALLEAEKGTPGVSMKKVLSFCFEYDPDEKRYTFQYIRIFGLVIPLLLFLFYFLVLRKGNQPRKDR